MKIILPDGQHRRVKRSATDLEKQTDKGQMPQYLPLISVRTILPVARFICGKQISLWEGKDVCTSKAAATGTNDRPGGASRRKDSRSVAAPRDTSQEASGKLLGRLDTSGITEKRRKAGR